MDIKYLGHSSFNISFKSASIITDPYDSSIGYKFKSDSATIVTISHDHDDHNNVSAVKDIKKVIKGPGEYEVEGITILGVESYHDNKNGEERGKNTIYIFEADDIRLMHLGDLGHKLTEKQAEKLGDVDILMIPVGGVYTIDPKTAVEVIQSIEPEIIIPMHYKTPDLNQSTFGELATVEEFVKELGMKSETTNKLSIKSTDFSGEDQKVVILERK